MTDQYEYFVEPAASGPTAMSEALWRRHDGTWEFLSSLDWSWHGVRPATEVFAPEEERLRSVTAEEARNLEADRHHWVRYWALYLEPPANPEAPPLTVARRRSSPERVLDESFTVNDRWEPTGSIREAESRQASSPPHLVEVDRPTAERILCEVAGVEGATRL